MYYRISNSDHCKFRTFSNFLASLNNNFNELVLLFWLKKYQNVTRKYFQFSISLPISRRKVCKISVIDTNCWGLHLISCHLLYFYHEYKSTFSYSGSYSVQCKKNIQQKKIRIVFSISSMEFQRMMNRFRIPFVVFIHVNDIKKD